MRRISAFLIFSVVFLGLQAGTKAQEILVPAGTLLRCTLDEPNFSSATADIGDPVICHLNSLREFGQNVFPRGSYLGGHLESDKEPGRFVGKGYLKVQFDRIGFPNSDVPVPAKVISARGYKVDRHGDIVGRGHATRDVVEWLIPPLWPWKILMLPRRGPRPTLKGEEQVTVRLMDDIQVPRLVAATQYSERPTSYDRPRPSYRPQSFDRPAGSDRPRSFEQAQAVKPRNVYAVTNYRIHEGSVIYVLSSGAKGSVDITEVDWRRTSHLNAEPIASSVAVRAANTGGPEQFSVR